jgi:predicted tellurium resistance membrane protein TerC
MEWLANPEAWIALLTLTILEIVLGIDNIVFISILADKLPEQQRLLAWRLGLALAMLTRIALLFGITLVMRLTSPLFALLGHDFSGRDLILAAGGLFLIYKSTSEIHEKLEGEAHPDGREHLRKGLVVVLVQIMLLDMIFSLDSVITAVGMTEFLGVMITAIVIAVGVMMLSASTVSSFVDRHPTIRMLALSFLLLIGMSLIAEGIGQHIPKGYIYFAMGFSIFVEILNQRVGRGRKPPVELRVLHVEGYPEDGP